MSDESGTRPTPRYFSSSAAIARSFTTSRRLQTVSPSMRACKLWFNTTRMAMAQLTLRRRTSHKATARMNCTDFIMWLVRASVRLSLALDRAAMAVAYGEEAAEHYGEPHSVTWAVRNWVHGFREGLYLTHDT